MRPRSLLERDGKMWVEPPIRRDNQRDSDLTEERALLEMARTQLGRSEFAASLQALSNHSRRFPKGRLVEERESLAVAALVGARRYDEAKARAARFERVFPSSVLHDAVQAALDEIPH